LREASDLPSSAVFNQLVNATSMEISVLKVEIRSGFEVAKILVDSCETMRPIFSGPCHHPTCCIGDEFDLEILRQAFYRLDLFARQLTIQFEETAAMLTLLHEKVRRLICHGADATGGNGHFTKQDGFGLEYGVQRLHEHRRWADPFLRRFDNFIVQRTFSH
jgi:hypothetical protein